MDSHLLPFGSGALAVLAAALCAPSADAQSFEYVCSNLPIDVGCYFTAPYLFVSRCGGECCIVCVADLSDAAQQCEFGIGQEPPECPDGFPPQGDTSGIDCDPSVPACWTYTQYHWDCGYDPRPGSVITVETVTFDCSDTSTFTWDICVGETIVDPLDPLTNGGPTLRLRVLDDGPLVVSAHANTTGQTIYWVETQVALPEHCPGDADSDGEVDSDDLSLVQLQWGNACGYDPDYPEFYCCAGDLDVDGDVDSDDLFTVVTNWGTCP